jgi:hypothetical protein
VYEFTVEPLAENGGIVISSRVKLRSRGYEIAQMFWQSDP